MAEESRKIFFSYAREDSEFVLRLVKELRFAGADVWLDQLDIGPGEHWDAAVETALRVCPCQVIVLSPEAVSSQNVMDEVSYALEEHKQVIPLLYRDCTVPFRLRRVQWVDFRIDYTSGLRDLARALGVKDAYSVLAPPVSPKERTQPLQAGIPAQEAAQPAGVAESPRRAVGTAEAANQEQGRRQVEQFGAAASQPRIWPEPESKAKIFWIVGLILVAIVLLIWGTIVGPPQH
jgi:hypothetical protein